MKSKKRKEKKSLVFSSFRKLLQLKTVILKNMFNFICYEDFYLLAIEVRLEQLSLIKVRTCESKCDIGTVFLPNLKVIEIRGLESFNPFLKKCPNLQELKVNMTECDSVVDFKMFQKLESAGLVCVSRKSTMCEFARKYTLKKLSILCCDVNEENIFCLNLESLEIMLCNKNPCLDFLRPSLRKFEKLMELSLCDGNEIDELLRIMSLQCPQLESLSLSVVGASGVYINRFVKLKKLIIECNTVDIPYSNLFYILKDLQYLKYLELDCATLYKDNFSIPMHTRDLAYSLETLILVDPENNSNFFKEMVANCQNSFQSIRTLHLMFNDTEEYFDMKFIRCLKQLTVLRTDKLFIHDTFCDEIKETSILHLSLCKGYIFYWSTLMNILKTCRLETIEIFEMILENEEEDYVVYKQIEIDHDEYAHLRKAIIPYGVFIQYLRFWKQCLEGCSSFQLFCYGYMKHEDVLEPLMNLFLYGKKSIKAIHANIGFENIKLFLAENKVIPKIRVHVLDEDSKDFWNPKFVDEIPLIMIEV